MAGALSQMIRGFLAGIASLFMMLPCAVAEQRAQFEVVRLNGEPVRWFPDERGKIVITYAIADRAVITPAAVNCGEMRAPDRILASARIDKARLRGIVQRGFAAWAQVADVHFIEAERVAEADVIIGEQERPAGWAFTNLIPGPQRTAGFRQISKGAICLNPERSWKDGYDGDSKVYDLGFTLTHEIGHILGLDHPSRRGQLMSFRYDETITGLTVGDIAGAAFMYGTRADRPIQARAQR